MNTNIRHNINIININNSQDKMDVNEDGNVNVNDNDELTCHKCNRTFQFKCYLDRHLKGKRNCELDKITDDGLYCSNCNRHYTNSFTLKRHLRTCKGNIQDNQDNQDIQYNNNQENNDNQEKNKEVKVEINYIEILKHIIPLICLLYLGSTHNVSPHEL